VGNGGEGKQGNGKEFVTLRSFVTGRKSSIRISEIQARHVQYSTSPFFDLTTSKVYREPSEMMIPRDTEITDKE
jgi:hypothetical protein